MRSPVGWICFGVSLLCVISAKSRVEGNYQIVHHGHALGYPPGQVYQTYVPAMGYRGVIPQMVVPRVELREYVNHDEHLRDQNQRIHQNHYDDEDEDEDDELNPHISSLNTGSRSSSNYHSHNRLRGVEDDEEERGVEIEGEEDEHKEDAQEENPDGEEHNMGHRSHSFKNSGTSQYNRHDEPDDSDENSDENDESDNEDGMSNQAYTETYSRKSTEKKISSSKANSKKTTSSRNKKPNKATTKPVEASPSGSASPQKLTETYDTKHKIQYIATPVADLILRLSISLAKPVAGHGNGTHTYFNVPIRIPETVIKGIAENSSSTVVNTTESEMYKPTEQVVITPEPIKPTTETIKTEQKDNQETKDSEDDDMKPVLTFPLTELPRK